MHSKAAGAPHKGPAAFPAFSADIAHGQRAVLYGKAHRRAAKGHAVLPPGVVLVAGAGILRQRSGQRGALWFRHAGEQLLREVHALQQFDGLILGPKILGDSTGIKPLWIIFAITVGGSLAGVVGMFLGVPAVAFLSYLIDRYLQYRLKKRGIPESRVDETLENTINLEEY